VARNIIQISEDFWNIRGSFRIRGIIDVGTQASLVRLGSGKFVFLDAYTLGTAAKRQIDELTHGGKDIEAILNLHPFHTLHVQKMHEMFPRARLYGTARHLSRFPELPWANTHTDDPALHKQYAEDLEFSVPRGVDFISANEDVHFSSVLALHRASKTIHVDDTLVYVRLPVLMRWFGLKDALGFHPTLAKALEKRAGSARDFREWANGLIECWNEAENLCAAHTTVLLADDNQGTSIGTRLQKALDRADKTLKSHERKYG